MRVPKGAANSVPWEPDLTPYLIEPMDLLSSREFDAVVFVSPARTGKTQALVDGWIVYSITCDPGDMLLVQMTQEKAAEHSKKRLARTFRASREVKKRLSPRRNDNNVHDKMFRDGSFLKIGWPSISIFSSSDYKRVALTDYDRFPSDVDGEGDAFSLASNPMQMVGMAFTHSTSDFGNILLDVANKSILQGWEDAPETFEEWTKKGQLSDFKTAHRVGLGGFQSLRQVREGAEYKYVTLNDKQATIALATYGELFSITRQAIINDDLSMLTDVPMKLGKAAKATIADLVYAILIDNNKMSTDGIALFDKAKHGNVLDNGVVMDVATLDKARQMMRQQKEGERHLNIRPAFVLVPTALEATTNQVIKSVSVKGADINAGIMNPVKDFATVIAEPRLDDKSATTFYLAAAKGTDTIEVAYLNGVDTPYIDQQEGFKSDGVTTKVRIDAGVSPIDYRGLVKCAG